MRSIFLGSVLFLFAISCESGDREALNQSLEENNSLVKESNNHALAFFALLAAENPPKGGKYYSFTEEVRKESKKLIVKVDSIKEQDKMFVEFEAYVRRMEDLCRSFQLSFQVDTPRAQNLQTQKLLIQAEVFQIEYQIFDELRNNISWCPPFPHFFGNKAYTKGDTTFLEVYPQQRSIISQNIRNVKLIRGEDSIATNILIEKMQHEKWLLRLQRLQPGSYQLRADVYMDNDYGWHDKKPIYAEFDLK